MSPGGNGRRKMVTGGAGVKIRAAASGGNNIGKKRTFSSKAKKMSCI